MMCQYVEIYLINYIRNYLNSVKNS